MRDARDLFELARSEHDDDTLVSIERDVAEIGSKVEDMEFRRMFADPMDPNNCFIDVQAGSGGTEAQDWASMLLRMYIRYCERKGYRVDVTYANRRISFVTPIWIVYAHQCVL